VDFKDLVMSFTKEGKKHTLKGITSISTEIITSHRMEKLLTKGHLGIIAQFNDIQGTPHHRRLTLICGWSLLKSIGI